MREEEARSRLGIHTKRRREHCETCRRTGASEMYQHEMQADRADPRKFAHTPDPTRSSATPVREWVRRQEAVRRRRDSTAARARLLGVFDQARQASGRDGAD